MREGLAGALRQRNHALHLIDATFWTGCLLPLSILMREVRKIDRRSDAIRTMMCISRYSLWPWPTGIVNAQPTQAGHAGLCSKLQVIKVALVILMVAIALFNRYVLLPCFRLAGRGGAGRARSKILSV